jgi:hypothetical protein
MKKYFLFLFFVTSICLAVGPQDIVIKTRFDAQSSPLFIQSLRRLMMNSDLGDPFNQRLETPFHFDLNEVLDDLPPKTQVWLKDLQGLLSLKLFESNYKLKIEGFSYSLSDFITDLFPIPSSLDRMEYVSFNYVQGLKIYAGKIIFEVLLQRTQNGPPLKFDIELINPEFLIHPQLAMELPMGWSSSLLKDSLVLSLDRIDLSRVFTKIAAYPDLIELRIEEVIIPELSLRIGNRWINFDREKIKKFISSRRDELKMAIIDLLKTRSEDRFSNILQDRPQEIYLPRENTIKADFNTVFNLEEIRANHVTKLVEAKMDGHFCFPADQDPERCRRLQTPAKMRRPIAEDVFKQSMLKIDQLFYQNKTNIAVSIDEHYLNQLIAAVVDAGILELGEGNFKLGPEKAFVLAEENGEAFNLYLDIIHKLRTSQRILVGKSELRFPVKLAIGLKMVLIHEIPHLQIKVLGLKTDSELLLNGVMQYGLPTNVNKVRFKKRVANQILRDIQSFDQKVLVEIKLEELKDTYLEDLSFYSDGLGRANAILNWNSRIKKD